MAVLCVFCSCKDKASLPTVSTGSVTIFQETKEAQCYGEVIADGGSVVYTRGICLEEGIVSSLSEGSPSVTLDGSGKGTFSGVFEYLSSGTTYSYCAYATNSAGTAYGDIKTFEFSAEKATIDDIVGTYSASFYDTSFGTTRTINNVQIIQNDDDWVEIRSLYKAEDSDDYYHAWGIWDESSQCITLYGGYYSADATWKLTNHGDTLFANIFYPVYQPDKSENSFRELYTDNEISDSGEAVLKVDNGKLIYGPSPNADSNGNYANAAVWSVTRLFPIPWSMLYYEVLINDIVLTKVSASKSPRRLTPKCNHSHSPIIQNRRAQKISKEKLNNYVRTI